MNFYRTNFEMVHEHNFSLTELENMMPWERDVHISLLNHAIQKKQEAMEKARRRSSR
jgi:hypothetical protein